MKACSLLDEVCHGLVGHAAFEGVPALDLAAPALEFECDERTQATEEVVADGSPATHEEAFSVAHLLERTMRALDGPMLPVGM